MLILSDDELINIIKDAINAGSMGLSFDDYLLVISDEGEVPHTNVFRTKKFWEVVNRGSN